MTSDPSITYIILQILGAVCLLLWGTRMVRMGFSRAYGTNMRRIIKARTKNRISAFLSGLGVTALLQSATATALIITSFARQKYLSIAAALAVIIGADLATTLVAQVLIFDLSWLSPALLVIGISGHMLFEHGGRKKHIFRTLIGLGLMLLALSLIKGAAEPLKTSETLPLILNPLQAEPILAILIAAGFTWLIHSSLAAVLLFAAFAGKGVIDLDLGLLLIIGANIGGALIAFVVTFKSGAISRQITGGNMIMRIIIALACLPFLGMAENYLGTLHTDPAHQMIYAHTGMNVILALIFLPILTPFTALCKKTFPDNTDKKDDPSEPLYLDKNALSSPVVAMAGAARETLRMAELIQSMFLQTMKAIENNDPKLIKKIQAEDHIVDSLYTHIKLYMTELSQESLDPKEADRYLQILTYSTNLEYAGDVIDKNLMELAEKKASKQNSFSKEGLKEIRAFHKQVLLNMKMAQTIFLSEDPNLAQNLVDEKKAVRLAEVETSRQHFERLRDKHVDTLATSSLHLDIIRDYRRINSYITTVAHSIVENAKAHDKERQKRHNIKN
jgi:phosphate:Na+ symporter